MKKGEKELLKKLIILLSILILLIIFSICYIRLSGKVVESNMSPGEYTFGPSQEEQQCMMQCAATFGCGFGDKACMSNNSATCMAQCGITGAPKPADKGEACMQECVVKGCGEFDFTCQEGNKETCEEECDMKGDAPDESEMSEEQLCITKCVNSHSPGTICKPSQEGEQGNDVCKMCAQQCVHLYEGPCLDDAKLKEKQKECESTCAHCCGEPVMGDSGEGWDCIVDVECGDATGEFGDNPGSGEGIVANVGEAVGNVFEGIGNFFKGLFGGDEEIAQE